MSLLFLLSIFSLPIHSQDINGSLLAEYDQYFHKAIGLDENLINGYQYDNLYPGIPGHVFLGENLYMPGSVVLNKKTYPGVTIKYDILNQIVVMSYINSSGGTYQIVLQKDLIAEFQLGDKHFRKIDFVETGPHFFQVVSNRRIKCLYFWSKSLEVNSGSVQNYYQYSNQSRKSYLFISDSLEKYRGNRSFIMLFPVALQSQIKAYIRIRKIQVKEASDETIRTLIEFCESLIYDGDRI